MIEYYLLIEDGVELKVDARACRPFVYGEEEMIEHSKIYNGFEYTRKRSAYEARAQEVSEFNKSEWEEMIAFFERKCCRCGSEVIGDRPSKDHIISVSLGGSNNIRNLQPLCRQCNTSIGHKAIDYRLVWCQERHIELPEKWRLFV